MRTIIAVWIAAIGSILIAGCAEDASAASREQVEQGRQLFTTETFGGNGRTCATCHPPAHNYTIDAQYVRRLRPDDPLFTAAIADPAALEQALIPVHADGPDRPPVLRAVPHLYSLSTTHNHDVDGTYRFGWSGDLLPQEPGEYIEYPLREVTRIEIGRHFGPAREPTEEELEAIEAFLLSLGRQQELDLFNMTLVDPLAEQGRQLFYGEPPSMACISCHYDAGANTPPWDYSINANDYTGTNLFDDPPDGGFGLEPGPLGYGDNSFNPPPLVEAADTPPYFHNNSAATLEDAIAHYDSDEFVGAAGRYSGPLVRDEHEIAAIAAMLRALGAVAKATESIEAAEDAMRAETVRESRRRINQAIREASDSIKLLRDSELCLDAVRKLRRARSLELQARHARQTARRNALLGRAVRLTSEAGDLVMEYR